MSNASEPLSVPTRWPRRSARPCAGVVAPHHQRLGEGVVRPAEGDAPAARRGHLEAVQDDVEVAALERRDEVRPVVLHELGAHAEAPRQRVGDLDLEADRASRCRSGPGTRRARRPARRRPSAACRGRARAPGCRRHGSAAHRQPAVPRPRSSSQQRTVSSRADLSKPRRGGKEADRREGAGGRPHHDPAARARSAANAAWTAARSSAVQRTSMAVIASALAPSMTARWPCSDAGVRGELDRVQRHARRRRGDHRVDRGHQLADVAHVGAAGDAGRHLVRAATVRPSRARFAS